jgi:hypothetical protein
MGLEEKILLARTERGLGLHWVGSRKVLVAAIGAGAAMPAAKRVGDGTTPIDRGGRHLWRRKARIAGNGTIG